MNRKLIFRYSIGIVLLLLFMLMSSCRKDFETHPSSGDLRFSADTVYLDTVFSEIGSSTYRLTVYNDSKSDITVPNIKLEEGESSNYRLNVDGVPGKDFTDVDILSKDSIFVFVETTANIEELTQNNNQYLYTDRIQFDSDDNLQTVDLVTLIQDAHFLYPEKFDNGSTETLTLGEDEDGNPIEVSGFFLADNALNFTNEKPYVIYGYAAIPPQKTLEIDAGARIHFHDDGGLIAANEASLHVNGELSNDPDELENEVIFQSDRLEPDYNETPGQWQTIWLTEGSTDHKIKHATIKNATAGIRIESSDGGSSPTLEIENTQIYNCSTVGLWALTSHIEGRNLAINNCGQASLYLALGGKYNFYNSTFANYWSNGFRDFPAVLIQNYYETPETIFLADLEEANFYNSIIYGSQDIELLFGKSDEVAFNYNFENSLIRFHDYNGFYAEDELYDFENTDHFKNDIFNENPDFYDASKNELIISSESPAKGLANPQNATNEDILGNSRGSSPDAGAYENEEFEED